MSNLPGPFSPPYRQIHLDFHTHGSIENVAAEFDPEQFASTLKRAHVESVTCFARCHHGWMYYDSAAFPDRIHPNLQRRDLLGEQIEACHKAGIRVPVYTTVQWDALTAERSPGWRVVDADGKLNGGAPYEPGFYRNLCYKTAYRDFLKAHTTELLDRYPLDGLFFDIVFSLDCSCPVCRVAMESDGLDPSDDAVRTEYARRERCLFMEEMSALARSHRPEISIYFNPTGVRTDFRSHLPSLTHIEFDALPSTHPEGYMNFPVMGRYLRNSGYACVGQTGRFHRWWGDFGSYKNRAALEYDCSLLLAHGCRLMIGDQLAPSGKLDPEVYSLVGGAYYPALLKEPWCRDARALTDIAVLHPDAYSATKETKFGVVRMLEEGGHQFDIVDAGMPLDKYRVVVLPDSITVEPDLKSKLDAYLAGGGSLIASFESGMDAERSKFTLDALGVEQIGPGPMAPDGLPARGRKFHHCDYANYILPREEIAAGLRKTEQVMYMRGVDVKALDGAIALADAVPPLFDRTYRHYCSHNQAPPAAAPSGPAVVQSGRCIYFSHKIFEIYAQYAPFWVKRLFLNALERLLPDPLLKHDGPITLQTSVTEQPEHDRQVIHLLHYVPLRRAVELEVIEEATPVTDLKLSLRTSRPVKRVALRPQQYYTLDFWEQAGRTEFVVPRFTGHAMIAVEFS